MWPFTSSDEPAEEASACPVRHDNQRDPRTGLSTEREVSSIPRFIASSSPRSSSSETPPADGAESACPHATKPEVDEKWVYPSPSSFYNALERKNRNPDRKDMDIVVPIHNAVNERCWAQVMQWEREALERQGRPDDINNVKLVSFKGRPKDLSPRARWKSLIGYSAPFDRHDWVVSRPSPSNPEEDVRIRYVIDFYTGRGAGLLSEADQGKDTAAGVMSRPNLAFFIDCRPAIDGFEEIKMRSYRWLNSWSSSPSQQTA